MEKQLEYKEMQDLKSIVKGFVIDDIPEVNFKAINQGYINDTHLVLSGSEPTYILQRINHAILKDVDGLQSNISKALGCLSANNYSEIKLLRTQQGNAWLEHKGGYWRMMSYIPDSVVYDNANNTDIAKEAGRIIGAFHLLLEEENIKEYSTTLPNFHNLNFRVREFGMAIEKALKTRRAAATNELGFAMRMVPFFDDFHKYKLPLRVCHNDTKLNNILFNKANRALCLIDLDTIMPGYFHFDFGDAVRTVVNPAKEDETDHSKVKFRTNFFKAFLEGMALNGNCLSAEEKEVLPMGAVLIPYLHGLRALTDYLNNDIYYKTTYENQNLDRCKSLFHFVRLAMEKQTFIKEQVFKILG